MIKNSYYKAIMEASLDGILPEMGDYWRNHSKTGKKDYTEAYRKSDLIDFLTIRIEMRRKQNV